jgi:CheY-like chemotaxis protein
MLRHLSHPIQATPGGAGGRADAPGPWPLALVAGSDDAPAPSPPPAASPHEAPGRQTTPLLRVLYIDDNPVNTLLMAAMFERLPGLMLRCECDPHLGVTAALDDPPDLLLIDIQMPGLDGYQVLRLLRTDPATRTVPAVAVSANAMPQDVARGQAAGFADYLTKPLGMQRLQSALRAVLPDWSPEPPASDSSGH